MKDTWNAWDLVETDIPPPTWTVKNLLPYSPDGVKLLITGPPKAGKSRLLTDLVFSLATGYPWLGDDGFEVFRQAPVLLVNEENTVAYFKNRLVQLVGLAELGEVEEPEEGGPFASPVARLDPELRQHLLPLVLWVRRGVMLNDDEWLDAVQKASAWLKVQSADALCQPWIFFDTWGKTQQFSFNSYEEVTRSLELFSQMLREGVNVGLVHHTNKDKDARDDAKTLGSQAIAGWYDAHLQITYKRKDGGLTVRREFREHEPLDELGLSFDDETHMWKAHEGGLPKARPEVIDRVKQWLMMPGGEWMGKARNNAKLTAQEMLAAYPDVGVKEDTLRKHISTVLKEIDRGDHDA